MEKIERKSKNHAHKIFFKIYREKASKLKYLFFSE